jgi:hypothetical protein
MKLTRSVAFAAVLGLGAIVCHAQAQSSPQPKNVPAPLGSTSGQAGARIDPAKAADIRKLLDLVGTKDLVMQSMGGTMQQLKPLMTSALPPGAYREQLVDLFVAKFQSKFDLNQILELAVPAYDRHFSHEEIKELIKFYQTPLGQKAISTLPKLSNELRDEGGRVGQQIGRDAMAEVLAEHPDLAQQLEEAKRATVAK